MKRVSGSEFSIGGPQSAGVATLEYANQKGAGAGRTEWARTEHALRERVKELNCLYGVSRVVEHCGRSVDKLLQGIVDLLPGSWQYPEVCCARVILEGREYVTAKFSTSDWKQSAGIGVGGEPAGVVEVYYLERMPELDEGPFLKEERLLINALAERIGKAVERIRAERQLEVERASLQNMNIALREVLARVQEERSELARAIQANVDKIVMPILDALESELSVEQRQYAVLLRRNLGEITSPFADELSHAFTSLTPAEIRICDMIRRGLSTKEIARLRGSARATVSRHREHIRSKLGIANESVNLTTYLNTFMQKRG